MNNKKSNPKPNSNKQFDYLAKVVIIGNSAVGKTNILLRYVNENHHLSHTPTIGVDFKSKIVTVKGSFSGKNNKSIMNGLNSNSQAKRIKLQMWDTAGQQRFRTITQTYYNGASGIVIVYAVNDRKSFQDVNQWLLQIAKHSKEVVPKLILGNKCDLTGERKVNFEQGKVLASENKALFMQVSAKQDINIAQAFMMLSKQIKVSVDKQANKDNADSNNIQSGNVKLSVMMSSNQNKDKKKNCC